MVFHQDGLLGIYDSKNELDIITNLHEFPVNQVNDSEIPQIISNLPIVCTIYPKDISYLNDI